MKCLTDSAGRWFDVAGRAFLEAGTALENSSQNQDFWPGE